MTKANINNVKRVLNTIIEQTIHITGSNKLYILFYTNDVIQLVPMFLMIRIKESRMAIDASSEYRSRWLAGST